jgi:hypothetical protein
VLVKCQRCGKFALAPTLVTDLPHLLEKDRTRAATMSHIVRRSQPDGSRVLMINHETVESYWRQNSLPGPNEQASELILWIGDNQPDSATKATWPELALDAWIGSALPPISGNATGLRWLVAAMQRDSPGLSIHVFEHRSATFELTLFGWDRYASLKKAKNDSRTAFMAMKFGDPELDHAVDWCFRPAVKRAGFELRVLTDQQRAGLVDDQIRAALLSARFVIADLTHGNPGAYWEAGFADGRNLPVIYTCRRAEWDRAKTHFDTNHMVTIIWDPGDLRRSEDQMAATIRATLRAEAKQVDD